MNHRLKFSYRGTAIVRRFCLSLLLAVVAAAGTGCISDSPDEPDSDSGIKPGSLLPEFSISTSDGTPVPSNSLEGKVSVLVFFRTSCPDCRAEFPVIELLYGKYRNSNNVVVLGIGTGEPAEDIAAYWKENLLSFPYSPQPDRQLAYETFGISSVPQIYISDIYRTVRYVHGDNPLASFEEIDSEISALLGENGNGGDNAG